MKIDGQLKRHKKDIENLFEIAGNSLGQNFEDVALSLNFVSEKNISQLNKRFRQIDKATDVLSFPNLEICANQNLSDFQVEKSRNSGLLFLGDIVICKRIAKRQAKEFGHNLKREICFLSLHGLLHLLGFDHVDHDGEKVMMETAEKILKEFGVER